LCLIVSSDFVFVCIRYVGRKKNKKGIQNKKI